MYFQLSLNGKTKHARQQTLIDEFDTVVQDWVGRSSLANTSISNRVTSASSPKNKASK